MTGERRINWAPSSETPKYRTEDDDPTGGNFVVAEDVGGATVLLQWNDTASQWEFAGDVDLGSNDITNVGSINTDDATINNAPTSSTDALRFSEGVEVGSVTGDGVDNSAGTDGWGDNAGTSVSETFDSSFGSTPKVATAQNADLDDVPNNQYKVIVNNISTTGFDAFFLQMSADDQSGTTDAYAVDYVASEGR